MSAPRAVRDRAPRELRERLDELSRQFTADVATLFREALETAVQGLLAEMSPAPAARATRREGPASAPRSRPPGGAAGGGGTRRRRSAASLEEGTRRVVDLVRERPSGVTVGELAAALGVETRELGLPLRRALDEGAIRKVGERRATRYLPPA